MMIEVFADKEMPFYKFGDIMFLEKTDSAAWSPFRIKKFRKTGKSIAKKMQIMA